MKQPFETLDERTLLDAWSTEIRLSSRVNQSDDDDDDKRKDVKCVSDIALNQVMDITMRRIIAAFWHKGRREYVEWSVAEIADRCGISQHDIAPVVAKMAKIGAIKFRLNRANRFSLDREIEVMRLTDIAMSVATIDRDVRMATSGIMTPQHLRSVRGAMGIQHKHLAARINIDASELIDMEKGKKPITKEVAVAIEREHKLHFSRLYTKHK